MNLKVRVLGDEAGDLPEADLAASPASTDFVDAIRTAISFGVDTDTLDGITGGIALVS